MLFHIQMFSFQTNTNAKRLVSSDTWYVFQVVYVAYVCAAVLDKPFQDLLTGI
jgi:hypothetical protein